MGLHLTNLVVSAALLRSPAPPRPHLCCPSVSAGLSLLQRCLASSTGSWRGSPPSPGTACVPLRGGGVGRPGMRRVGLWLSLPRDPPAWTFALQKGGWAGNRRERRVRGLTGMDCPRGRRRTCAPTKCRIQDSERKKHWAGKAEAPGCALRAKPLSPNGPQQGRAAMCGWVRPLAGRGPPDRARLLQPPGGGRCCPTWASGGPASTRRAPPSPIPVGRGWAWGLPAPCPLGCCGTRGRGCQAQGPFGGEGGVIVPGRRAAGEEGPTRLPCPLAACPGLHLICVLRTTPGAHRSLGTSSPHNRQ